MSKPNLKEIYDSNIDVRDSYIPLQWKDSFNEFINGQTCYMIDSDSGREFCYYLCDFRRWYNQNKTVIERDINLNEILDNDY